MYPLTAINESADGRGNLASETLYKRLVFPPSRRESLMPGLRRAIQNYAPDPPAVVGPSGITESWSDGTVRFGPIRSVE